MSADLHGVASSHKLTGNIPGGRQQTPETENDKLEHQDVQEGGAGAAQHPQAHLQDAACSRQDSRIFPYQFWQFYWPTENSSHGRPKEIVFDFKMPQNILLFDAIALLSVVQPAMIVGELNHGILRIGNYAVCKFETLHRFF